MDKHSRQYDRIAGQPISDCSRDVTAVISPNALHSEGRQLSSMQTLTIPKFADWPVWLQIVSGFVMWLSLYPARVKTQRGRWLNVAFFAGAVLFYFLFLRHSR
jgi:hypothetical protein